MRHDSRMTSAVAGSPVRRVMIVIAMEQEALPIVTKFRLTEMKENSFLPGAPFKAWVGDVGAIVLTVIWCGRDPRFGGVNNVATTAAAVATYASVAAFGKPDLLISAGTAGGFRIAGAAVGDCFLSSKCVFHARRIPSDEGLALEEYGFGHFRSPPLSALAARAGLKVGVVSTSDSLDSSELDLELMRGEGAAVKEMEAASVAWVCQTLSVPFIALKAITDIVDGEHATRSEFEANLHMASEALQRKVGLVLELLSNTTLRQWASGAAGASAAGNATGTGEPPVMRMPDSEDGPAEALLGAPIAAAADRSSPSLANAVVAGMIAGHSISLIARRLVAMWAARY